jgi:hypothetical protein
LAPPTRQPRRAEPAQEQRAANLDFGDKKERYFATKGKVSPFALITTVITVPSGRQRSSANDKRSF